jgi:hypothetical protein
MLLCGEDLKGDLKIKYGKFGFWEHYWLEYTLKDKVYFIDLTLQQFVSSAPRLAISEAKETERGYYAEFCDGTPIQEYVDGKRAEIFYTNPYFVD